MSCPRSVKNSLPRSTRDSVFSPNDCKAEGRQLQALVDEAFADLIEKVKQAKPRSHVMAAYLSTHDKYGELYKKLAK